ncbi:MAG: hypothetical protein JWL64_493 [Frankiales bacterium]|nr:hypothetical protein [Frankiales bacterium]
MTYGVVTQVPEPIEAYDAVHAEIVKAIGDAAPPGLIFHAARPTTEGFEIYEVWESKQHSDAFNAQVVGLAIELTDVDTEGPQEPVVTEFEPRGLMVPGQRTLAS